MQQLTRMIAIILATCALLLTVFLGTRVEKQVDTTHYEAEPLSPLTLIAPDVGKGDAFLLISQGKTLLIDTGYDDTADLLLEMLQTAGVETIDTLILTHFDKDHVGGADKVLEAIPVGQILVPDYSSDSKQYRQFAQAAQKAGLTPQPVTQPLEITLGSETAGTVYPPLLKEYAQENDFSLVVSLTHGADSFLFAGDAEKLRLQELLGQLPSEHTFLKVPHHGGAEDNSRAFFKAVSPRYALITCSEKDPPDDAVLSLLRELDAEVYLTADHPCVTFTSDGTGRLAVETAD
ncbi:MAG: MBL fold metallo-hydrolase [Oscillospiraceae bacterium]|nr:MBL fold metallo-hydrolase [Oscillospiraceae bacterium]